MTKTAIMAENKLILLYLIYQLDMPISWADLLDFAVPNYMDYMDFQIYLQEMVENGIVEKLNEDNGYFTLLLKMVLNVYVILANVFLSQS